MRVNEKTYSFYILTNIQKNVLYCGMTNNLEQRIIEHYLSCGDPKTFCGRYHCYWLIYFEHFPYPMAAIVREKEVKKWRREKKNKLIEGMNPEWNFLNYELFESWPPPAERLFHRKDLNKM